MVSSKWSLSIAIRTISNHLGLDTRKRGNRGMTTLVWNDNLGLYPVPIVRPHNRPRLDSGRLQLASMLPDDPWIGWMGSCWPKLQKDKILRHGIISLHSRIDNSLWYQWIIQHAKNILYVQSRKACIQPCIIPKIITWQAETTI